VVVEFVVDLVVELVVAAVEEHSPCAAECTCCRVPRVVIDDPRRRDGRA
jgi:hypothetical protein